MSETIADLVRRGLGVAEYLRRDAAAEWLSASDSGRAHPHSDVAVLVPA